MKSKQLLNMTDIFPQKSPSLTHFLAVKEVNQQAL